MWKTVLATLAIAACVGPAWGQSLRAEILQCRKTYPTQMQVAHCFNAAEARYWPLSRSPIYAGLLQRVQRARLELTSRLEQGEISVAQYTAGMEQVYAEVGDMATQRFAGTYGGGARRSAPPASDVFCSTLTSGPPSMSLTTLQCY
jgi:hypothetical protein